MPMDYKVSGNDIILRQPDFDLGQTLDCGQAFRWEEISGGWQGFYKDSFLIITDEDKEENLFRFHDVSEEEFLTVWASYFDLDEDYGKLKKRFSSDGTLKEACAFAGGIRLLRQDSWEALCSFLISQNNNIPRIKGIIKRMCGLFGGFPTAERLASSSLDELAPLRSGFRAKYLLDAARKVSSGEVDLEELRKIPVEEARECLKKITGVGPKVAECALLYGLHRLEAFPVDVWIKRVLAEYYPDGFPEEFREVGGIAQQYLFHYIRKGR